MVIADGAQSHIDRHQFGHGRRIPGLGRMILIKDHAGRHFDQQRRAGKRLFRNCRARDKKDRQRDEAARKERRGAFYFVLVGTVAVAPSAVCLYVLLRILKPIIGLHFMDISIISTQPFYQIGEASPPSSSLNTYRCNSWCHSPCSHYNLLQME